MILYCGGVIMVMVQESISMTWGAFQTADSPLYQLSSATSLENVSYRLGMLTAPRPPSKRKKHTKNKTKALSGQRVISKVRTRFRV